MNFSDRTQAPREDATTIDHPSAPDDVLYWTFGEYGEDPKDRDLTVWHWCDRNVWLAKGGLSEFCEPRWVGGSVRNHELVSVTPLHLEPSVYWPGCCGKHGFIRAGVYADA